MAAGECSVQMAAEAQEETGDQEERNEKGQELQRPGSGWPAQAIPVD